uniref:Uncharacterized protein n=1 Tax=Aegilops tauschii subsp. strangulata TaxID=200361 RepID=A0A453PZ07_AEGTS
SNPSIPEASSFPAKQTSKQPRSKPPPSESPLGNPNLTPCPPGPLPAADGDDDDEVAPPGPPPARPPVGPRLPRGPLRGRRRRRPCPPPPPAPPAAAAAGAVPRAPRRRGARGRGGLHGDRPRGAAVAQGAPGQAAAPPAGAVERCKEPGCRTRHQVS